MSRSGEKTTLKAPATGGIMDTDTAAEEKKVEVLLVEHNALDSLLIKKNLERDDHKYSVHHARDGVEALDFLQKKPPYESVPTPDIIILDVDLPKLNGYQVLESVKQIDGVKEIPMIVMADDDFRKDIHNKIESWENRFNDKGVGRKEFITVIEAVENFLITSIKGDRTAIKLNASNQGDKQTT